MAVTGVELGALVCVLTSGASCGLAGSSPGVGARWSAGSPPAIGAWFGLDELAGSPPAMGSWSGGGAVGLGVIGGRAASSSVLCPFTGVGGVAGVTPCCGGVWTSSSSLSDDEYTLGRVVGG